MKKPKIGTMRVLTTEELEENGYGELLPVLNHFRHPAIEYIEASGNVHGFCAIGRWKRNKLIDHLVRGSAPFCEGPPNDPVCCRGHLDLNRLWVDFESEKFDIEELIKFYMDMGYSLCGFLDVFSHRPEYRKFLRKIRKKPRESLSF